MNRWIIAALCSSVLGGCTKADMAAKNMRTKNGQGVAVAPVAAAGPSAAPMHVSKEDQEALLRLAPDGEALSPVDVIKYALAAMKKDPKIATALSPLFLEEMARRVAEKPESTPAPADPAKN